MDLMNHVFQPYLDEFVIVFIDDIFIYSKNDIKHEEHLYIVLEVLRDRLLYGKLPKCDFWLTTMMFLGYMISSGQIYVDPSNVSVVLEWNAPLSPMEIRVS